MSAGRPCIICGTHYGACTNEQMAVEQMAAAEQQQQALTPSPSAGDAPSPAPPP